LRLEWLLLWIAFATCTVLKVPHDDSACPNPEISKGTIRVPKGMINRVFDRLSAPLATEATLDHARTIGCLAANVLRLVPGTW